MINDLFEHTLSVSFLTKNDSTKNSSKLYTYTRNNRKDVFFQIKYFVYCRPVRDGPNKIRQNCGFISIWSIHTKAERERSVLLSYPWFTCSLARSHGPLRSPLEMVRLLAGYGFDEQINGNGYKRKARKLNQTSLSIVLGTLYRIRGKLRIFIHFHP